MKNMYKRIGRLSDSDDTDIFRRLVKLGEEYGEFCAATLEEDGFKVAKSVRTVEQQRDHILEEGVDTLIMAFDILRHKGFSIGEIKSMMIDKLAVWEGILIKKGKIKIIEEKPTPKIIQNARQCLVCGKIISSKSTHDYVECGCENQCMVDGGKDYCRYGAVDIDKTVNLSLDDQMPKKVIEANLLWGTYGKDGTEPLQYKKISGLENDHLLAILKNCHPIAPIHLRVIITTLKKRKVKLKI